MPIKQMFNNETINSNFSRKIDFQQNGMKSSKGENIHKLGFQKAICKDFVYQFN